VFGTDLRDVKDGEGGVVVQAFHAEVDIEAGDASVA
jgi:hypothetical protein